MAGRLPLAVALRRPGRCATCILPGLPCPASCRQPAATAAFVTADAMAQQVRASHLLVKHRGSRRPASWKEPVVTRSEEEALAMVQAFR